MKIRISSTPCINLIMSSFALLRKRIVTFLVFKNTHSIRQFCIRPKHLYHSDPSSYFFDHLLQVYFRTSRSQWGCARRLGTQRTDPNQWRPQPRSWTTSSCIHWHRSAGTRPGRKSSCHWTRRSSRRRQSRATAQSSLECFPQHWSGMPSRQGSGVHRQRGRDGQVKLLKASRHAQYTSSFTSIGSYALFKIFLLYIWWFYIHYDFFGSF